MGDDDQHHSSTPNPDSSSTATSTTISTSNRKSVHQSLGGGAVADVLLWKRWRTGAFVLVTATTMWILFEIAGYSLLSFAANVLLLLVTILFLWAKSASVLNRPLPPLPNLELSDAMIEKFTASTQVWINRILGVAHDITLKGDWRLFLKVVSGLFVVSYLGSLFSFLTLAYFVVLISLAVPPMYHKFQDHIDDKLNVTHKALSRQYSKIDENILSKLSKAPVKDKKIQ
ncbi:reticulon-like protein B11 [Papaver somniferum]|uniref:reticulon-like protein B11 n=1 Tax=Papaver somniferum TaxID=3469 RepID=UPI000E6FE82E|nr:reticulon-like protein B11 [Papaver somniferum]